jgi:uncharacterized protein
LLYNIAMKELNLSQISIQDSFWTPRLQTNAQVAIFHQWRKLEESHCVDNFRLAASQKEGFREGWFFADSDAYKWLEAAARIYANWPNRELKSLMDGLLDLLECVQMEDGYIYTYNQIHFPGERWENLIIEHELYCHGHLIEAGVSHYEVTGEDSALKIAIKAADLLVRDFLIATPDKTSGHEEVEIALLRLYQVTHQANYLELARQFLERRGRVQPFAHLLLQQNQRVTRRSKYVQGKRQEYLAKHPEYASFKLPADNFTKKARFAKLNWAVNTLTGKYFQQHTTIRKQIAPVGHSVRFTYLETATAMLHRLTGDAILFPALVNCWERMVTRRMYVTGGLGSRPEIEGFGQDYDLDPEMAYAETCATLGSLFWNWEMALSTGDACYSDLFEWQLYNAAAVGMGLSGDSYLYNNPLLCKGGITRQSWFKVPCCPSNLSRTWASLGKYVYSFDDTNLWIHQFIGNQARIEAGQWTVDLVSGLPWNGTVRFTLQQSISSNFTVHFRIPSWAGNATIQINGQLFDFPSSSSVAGRGYFMIPAASGYDPRQAHFLPIKRIWSPGDVVNLDFEMPITLRRALSRLHRSKRKVALTRGPLVYCLESVDNPTIDIFTVRINPHTVQAEYSPVLLGGIWILRGTTMDGSMFTAIPYHLWANRGASQMTVWLNG